MNRRIFLAAATAIAAIGSGILYNVRRHTTPEYLYTSVIIPVLNELGLDTTKLAPLLLGTALVETDLRHVRQSPGGPALGLYQMEPATHNDIINKLKQFFPKKLEKVQRFLPAGVQPNAEAMATNVPYATAMAAVLYEAVNRFKKELPPACDAEGQARYWKRWWNTPAGKGTPEAYMKSWKAADASSIVGCSSTGS